MGVREGDGFGSGREKGERRRGERDSGGERGRGRGMEGERVGGKGERPSEGEKSGRIEEIGLVNATN